MEEMYRIYYDYIDNWLYIDTVCKHTEIPPYQLVDVIEFCQLHEEV